MCAVLYLNLLSTVNRHSRLLEETMSCLILSGGRSNGGSGLSGLGSLGLLNDSDGVLLRLEDLNVVGETSLGTELALRVRRLHNSDSDTDDTSLHLNVSVSLIDEDLSGGTRGDHVTVLELHDLGSLGSQLTGDNNLNTLSTVLHDESEDTIGGSSDGQTVEQLVSQRLGLSGGRETSVVNSLGVELDRLVGETESSLDQSSQLSDSATLLTEHTSSSGGSDDDLGSDGGDSDLNTGVSILSQDASEELVQFGVENTVLHVLLLLGQLQLNISH